MNVVMNNGGGFVEVQGTAEGHAFRRNELDALLDLAASACGRLFAVQLDALQSRGRDPGVESRPRRISGTPGAGDRGNAGKLRELDGDSRVRGTSRCARCGSSRRRSRRRPASPSSRTR